MSYIQQYIEKTRGSPERISPSKLRLDLSDMSDSPIKTGTFDQYPMNFELNEAHHAGDDSMKGTNPNKSPSRSRIPLPQSKRATPQSYQEIEYGKVLDKKLRIKEAEVARLEQELKSLRDNLASKVKETTSTSRDVKDLRSDNERLSAEVEKLRGDNITVKAQLEDVSDARDEAKRDVKLISKQIRVGPTSPWNSARNLFFIAENLFILAGFFYLAYVEYLADVERQKAKSSWFGF